MTKNFLQIKSKFKKWKKNYEYLDKYTSKNNNFDIFLKYT